MRMHVVPTAIVNALLSQVFQCLLPSAFHIYVNVPGLSQPSQILAIKSRHALPLERSQTHSVAIEHFLQLDTMPVHHLITLLYIGRCSQPSHFQCRRQAHRLLRIGTAYPLHPGKAHPEQRLLLRLPIHRRPRLRRRHHRTEPVSRAYRILYEPEK